MGNWRAGASRSGQSRRLANCVCARAQRDADDVGHDGRGGRRAARAASVVHGVARAMAVDADGVERAGDPRQGMLVVDERGADLQAQAAVLPVGDGQQLDGVAELLAVADVAELQRVDARDGDGVEVDLQPERQRREDRQLVGRVGALDVQGRVRLGEASLLGAGQGVGVGLVPLRHRREDVVARAVDDAVQRVDAVGDQPVGQRPDDRHAAAATGLEGDAHAVGCAPGRTAPAP